MIDGGCGLCDDDGDDAVIYFIINNDNNYGYIVKLQFRVLNLHVFENYSVFLWNLLLLVDEWINFKSVLSQLMN